MLQVTDPTLREMLVALDFVLIFSCLEIAGLFLSRGVKSKATLRINGGWALVFGSLGLVQVINTWNIFYSPPAILDTGITISGALGLGLTIIIVAMLEYFYQRFHRTHFGFTIIGFCLAVIYLFVPESTRRFLSAGYFILLFAFTLSFFIKLIRLASGSVRRNIIIFTTAFYALMLGNAMSNIQGGAILYLMNLDIPLLSVVARILKIASYLTIFIVLGRIPIFFEVNWPEGLVQLLIGHRTNGVAIYQRQFRAPAQPPGAPPQLESDLVAGGMIGIATMLKEISRSEQNLQVIDHGDLKIMLEHGEAFFIALLVSEEMRIYRDKLLHLRQTIERLFGATLRAWDGNLKYFEPLVETVKSYFELVI